MRKKRKNLKLLIIAFSMLVVCCLCAATAIAAVTMIEASKANVAQDKAVGALFTSEDGHKAKAPEPSTMVLFGGGFLGMLAGFVRRTYAVTKRAFDVVGTVIGSIVLSPLMLLTVLLVKLTSKGPVIYSQVRVGKDGKPFDIYKFRTMKLDAEKETGPIWAAQNDCRLTPVGSFLRKAHLDELPQLFNVLRGEMSIIGPRPERPVFVEKFKETIPGYEGRLQVKPGITGLAQVWHRYDETLQDVKKKVRYDLLYIRNMCLLADVRIIFRTLRVVVTGEGAR